MTYGVTPYEGIRDASQGEVTFSQGGERWSNDEDDFPAAIEAATAADVAVVVVGTWSRDQNELWGGLNATTGKLHRHALDGQFELPADISGKGEHIDVHNLKLIGMMPRLVKAIIDTGTPTVVVYSSGKPITEPWISEEAAALVQMFYQGEQGGHALADILYGDVNPSGKLSVSFPWDIGTAPSYYDHLKSARRDPNPGQVYANGSMEFGSNYVLNSPLPMYEFGYGLSYSEFKYSNLQLSATDVSASDTVTVRVDITNEGDIDGKEVVQVYVSDVLASVDVPNKRLKGFSKVLVKAGETETVKIDLEVKEWGLWDQKMKYVVEPGDFIVLVGSSSEDFRGNATVTVH